MIFGMSGGEVSLHSLAGQARAFSGGKGAQVLQLRDERGLDEVAAGVMATIHPSFRVLLYLSWLFCCLFACCGSARGGIWTLSFVFRVY